jgi:hypothetical protein
MHADADGFSKTRENVFKTLYLVPVSQKPRRYREASNDAHSGL